MNKKNLVAGVCLVSMVLASCASYLLPNGVDRLRKGMSVTEAVQALEKGPTDTYRITLKSDPSRTFSVLRYNYVIGPSVLSDYIAAFEGDRLVYWGQPFEFKRFPDPLIAEIGTLTNDQISSE